MSLRRLPPISIAAISVIATLVIYCLIVHGMEVGWTLLKWITPNEKLFSVLIGLHAIITGQALLAGDSLEQQQTQRWVRLLRHIQRSITVQLALIIGELLGLAAVTLLFLRGEGIDGALVFVTMAVIIIGMSICVRRQHRQIESEDRATKRFAGWLMVALGFVMLAYPIFSRFHTNIAD